MLRLLRERRSVFGASLVSLLVVASVGIAAFDSQGYRTTKLDLNDGAVWTVNHGDAAVGRMNMQIPALDVSVAASSDTRLYQDRETVLLQTGRSLRQVDPRNPGDLGKGQEPRKLPDSAEVALGGPSGAILDTKAGDLWVAPRNALAASSESAAPTARVGANATMAVGQDGVVYAYAGGTKELSVVALDGSVSKRGLNGSVAAGDAQLTVVGGVAVLLDRTNHRIWLPGHKAIDLGAAGGQAVLQQPGPDADVVLVATGSSLLGVPLGGGDPVHVVDGTSSGQPVAPVRSGPCVFAAWTGVKAIRQCSGRPRLADDLGGDRPPPGAELVYRVNRGQVLLNDAKSGWNLVYQYDRAAVVDDWQQVLKSDEQDQQPQVQIDKGEQQTPPVCNPNDHTLDAKDYQGATRQGRPVVLHVLDQVKAPACRVLRVSLDDSVMGSGLTKSLGAQGEVAVIANGDALQYSPGPDVQGNVQFSFWVGDGSSRPQQRTATVQIFPADCTVDRNNEAPTPPDASSVAAVAVAPGKVAHYNVLEPWRDPNGDALTLRVASADRGGVQYQSNGQLTYTAASPGQATVSYTVADACGATSTGTLTVIVDGSGTQFPPSVKDVHVQVVAGQWATTNLLATASDPNDDNLTLQSVQPEAPAGWEITFDPGGVMRVRAQVNEAQSRAFTFTVTDGEKTARGTLRVDVLAPKGALPPIAVRDDVLVHPGAAALVDLTANDVDPGGGLLAVQQIDQVDGSGGKLLVELVDMHIARVTAVNGFTGSEAIRYVVSNGRDTASGVLVVRALDASVDLQLPVPADDDATVRGGNTVSVPVLRNDIDPQGQRLRLVSVDAPPGSSGAAWVSGDDLYFAASREAKGTVRLQYQVANEVGTSSGTVLVRVLPVAAPRQALIAPQLEARVFAGTSVNVRVPLLSVSPDGDIVSIAGLLQPPSLGQVTPLGDGYRFEAPAGAAGADEFTFRLRSDKGDETTGTVRVVIVPPPSDHGDPVVPPIRLDVTAGDRRVIDVLAGVANPYGDALSVGAEGRERFTQPSNGGGHVTLTDDVFTYEAPGSVTDGQKTAFSYTVISDRGGSARGTVDITLHRSAEQQPPIARDDFALAQRPGTTAVVDVLANDSDPMGHPERLVVRPDAGHDATFGPDRKLHVVLGETSVRFTYALVDPDQPGRQAKAVVTIPVADATAGPTTEPIALTVNAGESKQVDILSHVAVASGRTKSLVNADAARGGTITVDRASGKVTFTADPNAAGLGGFNYQVRDDKGNVAADRVAVTIRGVHPPTWQPQQVNLPAGTTRSIDLTSLLEVFDEGNTYKVDAPTGATGKIHASVHQSGERWLLEVRTDDDSFGEAAALGLHVTNTYGTRSVPADNVVNVQVTASDKPAPTLGDDRASTDEDQRVVIPVLDNDTDPVGKGLQITAVSAVDVDPTTGQPAGTASQQGDRVAFQPAAGFFGQAHLTYTAQDSTKEASHTVTANVSVIVQGKPGTPGKPSGTKTSHSVELSWAASAPRGDYPITYTVQASREGGAYTTVATDVTGNQRRIDGLTNGAQYRFKVRAHNHAGDSPEWSEPSDDLVPDQVPDAPLAVLASFPQPDHVGGQLTVTWDPAVVDGTPLLGYDLRWSGPGLSTAAHAFPAKKDTSYPIPSLRNGSSYVIQIRAQNSAGWSEWSSAAVGINNGYATAGTVPPAPAPPTVTDGDGSLGISWPAMSQTESSLPIKGYRLKAFRNGVLDTTFGNGGVKQFSSAPPPGAPYPYDATVANGSVYTFQLVVLNLASFPDPSNTSEAAPLDEGLVKWSAMSAPVTPAAKPGAPSAATATPADGGMDISLMANPDVGGVPLDRYEASLDGTTWSSIGLSLPGRLSGLSNGSPYTTVSVRACHPVSASNAANACSDPTAVTFPGGSPLIPFGAPTVTYVSHTNGDVSFQWAAQEGVASYSVTCSGGGRTYSHSDSPAGRATSTVCHAGPGGVRTIDVRVVPSGQGVSGPEGSKSGMTGDTRQAPGIAWGGSAGGMPVQGGGSCAAACKWVDVTLVGYEANRSYTISCYTDMGYPPSFPKMDHFELWKSPTITTDANGNATVRDGNGKQSGYCYIGLYAGGAHTGERANVYVTVDGLQSRTIN